MAILTTLLIIGSVTAGATGIGLGINGGIKLKKSNDKVKEAKKIHNSSNDKLKVENEATSKAMDILGETELKCLADFGQFSDLIETINNRPEFSEVKAGNCDIPKFSAEEIKKVSVGASVAISGIGSATLGTFGGFAAAGGTTAAVMALGTAGTGVAIADLSGVAATNATLAAIGGGTLASGGGGMALGQMVLGAASLGVGLLIGGAIFTVVGRSIVNKAGDALSQAQQNREKIDKICGYLIRVRTASVIYNKTLAKMKSKYDCSLKQARTIVNSHLNNGKADWNHFSKSEKMTVENLILIVGIIFHMCNVKFVKETGVNSINELNMEEIDRNRTIAEEFLKSN